MALSVCSAPPAQIGGIRVAKGSVESSASQEEREGEQVEDNSQSTGRARLSRVGRERIASQSRYETEGRTMAV